MTAEAPYVEMIPNSASCNDSEGSIGEAAIGDIIQKSKTPSKRVAVEPEPERRTAAAESQSLPVLTRPEAMSSSRRTVAQTIASRSDVVPSGVSEACGADDSSTSVAIHCDTVPNSDDGRAATDDGQAATD